MRVITSTPFRILGAVLLLLLLTVTTSFSKDIIKKGYADFDGDGINDNIDDDDGDGIPNNADPDFVEIEVNQQVSNAMDFGATINEMGLTADVGKNSDKFGTREFNGRDLSDNRCGFTSEDSFGSGGLGIDIGGGGGACAGGVCH